MQLTTEIIEEAARMATAHKLSEVFVSDMGHYFSSAREARNSGASEVRKAYPAPSIKEAEEDEEDLDKGAEKGDKITDLDTDNGHSGDGNSHENTAINTDKNTEDESYNAGSDTTGADSVNTEVTESQPNTTVDNTGNVSDAAEPAGNTGDKENATPVVDLHPVTDAGSNSADKPTNKKKK